MRTLLVGFLLLTSGQAVGQELLPAPKESKPVPVPKGAPPAPPLIVIGPAMPQPTAFYRVSAYEHWQHLSQGWDGRFYPRVLNTPHGTYYSATGQPYYWAPVDRLSIGSPGTMPNGGH